MTTNDPPDENPLDDGSEGDTPPRRCPLCHATMERCGRSYVCPTARSEARSISAGTRVMLAAVAAERVAGLPF